jgi:hypothetical protein
MTIRTQILPWLGDVAIAAAAAAGLYALTTLVVRWQISYALFLVVVLAALAGRRLVGLVAPPPMLESPVREDSELRAFGIPDRPFSDVRRWEDRLDLVQGDPAFFDRTVRPALATLVDERLRAAHGLTRASDPERAQAILGTRLFDFLEPAASAEPTERGTPTRSPSPTELAEIVTKMEDVWQLRA